MRSEPRTHMLRVRFSDKEWTGSLGTAHAAGMTMSALVRDHLGRVSIRNREDERQRLIRLNRINANLNMIARWVNTYRDRAETIQVISQLIAIQRYIRDLGLEVP